MKRPKRPTTEDPSFSAVVYSRKLSERLWGHALHKLGIGVVFFGFTTEFFRPSFINWSKLAPKAEEEEEREAFLAERALENECDRDGSATNLENSGFFQKEESFNIYGDEDEIETVLKKDLHQRREETMAEDGDAVDVAPVKDVMEDSYQNSERSGTPDVAGSDDDLFADDDDDELVSQAADEANPKVSSPIKSPTLPVHSDSLSENNLAKYVHPATKSPTSPKSVSLMSQPSFSTGCITHGKS